MMTNKKSTLLFVILASLLCVSCGLTPEQAEGVKAGVSAAGGVAATFLGMPPELGKTVAGGIVAAALSWLGARKAA